MLYHWSWFVFPRIMEHFTEVHESIEFLLEAATTINAKEQSWQGEVDEVALGQRLRPISRVYSRISYSPDFSCLFPDNLFVYVDNCLVDNCGDVGR